jgi:hypothetical protein
MINNPVTNQRDQESEREMFDGEILHSPKPKTTNEP